MTILREFPRVDFSKSVLNFKINLKKICGTLEGDWKYLAKILGVQGGIFSH